MPFTAEPPPAKRDRRSDLTVAALGITLGLICALFPWYIFFNQDEFGIRAMKFEGTEAETGPILLGSQPRARRRTQRRWPRFRRWSSTSFATGTTPDDTDENEHGTPGVTGQPFPPLPVNFRLVHVANGRAMIEDDSGLFVVQRGSRAAGQSSHVESIEAARRRLGAGHRRRPGSRRCANSPGKVHARPTQDWLPTLRESARRFSWSLSTFSTLPPSSRAGWPCASRPSPATSPTPTRPATERLTSSRSRRCWTTRQSPCRRRRSAISGGARPNPASRSARKMPASRCCPPRTPWSSRTNC